MKTSLTLLIAAAACSLLSGCYYNPDYSYVRGGGEGDAGDAYYGDAPSTVYEDDGYAPGYSAAYSGYYGDGYGGYGGYGCCYSSGVAVGVSSTWVGGGRYRYDDSYRAGQRYRSNDHGWYGRSGRDRDRSRDDGDRNDRHDYSGSGDRNHDQHQDGRRGYRGQHEQSGSADALRGNRVEYRPQRPPAVQPMAPPRSQPPPSSRTRAASHALHERFDGAGRPRER